MESETSFLWTSLILSQTFPQFLSTSANFIKFSSLVCSYEGNFSKKPHDPWDQIYSLIYIQLFYSLPLSRLHEVSSFVSQVIWNIIYIWKPQKKNFHLIQVFRLGCLCARNFHQFKSQRTTWKLESFWWHLNCFYFWSLRTWILKVH